MKHQEQREQLSKAVRLYKRGLLTFPESLNRMESIISGLQEQETDCSIQEQEKLYRYGLNLLVKQSARRYGRRCAK